MNTTLSQTTQPIKIPIWVILFIAALNGLVYVFLVPPWQHYDEPGNFEYVWLMANLNHKPEIGEYDQEMRREMAASMVEHNFFRGMNGIPNLIAMNEGVWIGIAQLNDPPLYYFIASLPLRLLAHVDITLQLYLTRLVSWGLFLLTILIARFAAVDIFGENSNLTWCVPLFLAGLPGFVDVMTAVNNDVGAIAFMTIYFWLAARILIRGVNLMRFLGIVIVTILAYYTKSTAWVGLLFLPFVLLWGVPGKRAWRIVQMLITLAIIGAVLSWMFDWKQRTAAWYFPSDNAIQQTTNTVPLGKFAIKIHSQTEIKQMVTRSALDMLAGKPATLGLWLWSDQPVSGNFVQLVLDGNVMGEPVSFELSDQPKYYAFPFIINDNIKTGWVNLSARDIPQDAHLYIDGLVFAEGDYATNAVPTFADEGGKKGIWGGKPFVNLLRNGSGEMGFPILSAKANELFTKGFIGSGYFWTFLDISGAGFYFRGSFWRILQTFWGYFGWAHVPLMGGSWVYTLFLTFTIIGLTGIVLGIFMNKRSIEWRLAGIFSAAVVGQLWVVMMRYTGSWFTRMMFPVARYFFPVILPMSIGLCWGWMVLTNLIGLKAKDRIWLMMNILLLFGLNLWAWLSLYFFYYGGNHG